jgi:hypothetical protein
MGHLKTDHWPKITVCDLLHDPDIRFV